MIRNPSILQAVAIPYRITSVGLIEFCMITSTKKRVWIFPKGTVDPGETPEMTALKEADEEAGLLGTLDPMPLGTLTMEKWEQEVQTYFFLMHVTETNMTWLESDKRARCWRSSDKAIQKLGKPYLEPYLKAAIKRIRSGQEIREAHLECGGSSPLSFSKSVDPGKR